MADSSVGENCFYLSSIKFLIYYLDPGCSNTERLLEDKEEELSMDLENATLVFAFNGEWDDFDRWLQEKVKQANRKFEFR